MSRKTIGGLILASAVAIGSITQYEGFKSDAYVDMAGIPTIGYGSTKDVKIGDRIDEKGARSRLIREVMDTYGQGVKNCVKVPLHQSEYDAYVSLTYNIGVKAFCSSTIVKKLNQEDYFGACKAILNFNKAKKWVKEIDENGNAKMVRKKVVVKGLDNRRKGEYNLCILDHQQIGVA